MSRGSEGDPVSRLAGKVAIVTGGASGMGADYASRFVAEGASVVVADINHDDGAALAEQLGASSRFVPLDVTQPAEWRAAVAATTDAFGPPTVLVNNAGITGWASILDGDVDSFRHMLDVNLVSMWLGMQAVAPSMIAAGGGSIVNVSSDAGMTAYPNLSAYVTSKWGARGLTRAAAVELGQRGVRVNVILPGLIDTPMGRLALGSRDPAEVMAAAPIPRIGRVDEITNLVVFLASDESSYCTGADWVADAGMLAGRAPAGD